MASTLNVGFKNNKNVIQLRSDGTVSQRLTDRAFDFDGNGQVEKVSVVTTPTGVGSKVREIVTKPVGVARSVIQAVVESDGGWNKDSSISEYTVGVE